MMILYTTSFVVALLSANLKKGTRSLCDIEISISITLEIKLISTSDKMLMVIAQK